MGDPPPGPGASPCILGEAEKRQTSAVESACEARGFGLVRSGHAKVASSTSRSSGLTRPQWGCVNLGEVTRLDVATGAQMSALITHERTVRMKPAIVAVGMGASQSAKPARHHGQPAKVPATKPRRRLSSRLPRSRIGEDVQPMLVVARSRRVMVHSVG